MSEKYVSHRVTFCEQVEMEVTLDDIARELSDAQFAKLIEIRQATKQHRMTNGNKSSFALFLDGFDRFVGGFDIADPTDLHNLKIAASDLRKEIGA